MCALQLDVRKNQPKLVQYTTVTFADNNEISTMCISGSCNNVIVLCIVDAPILVRNYYRHSKQTHHSRIETSMAHTCWNRHWKCVMFAFDIGIKRLRGAFGNTTNIEKEICSLFPHTRTHALENTLNTVAREFVSVLCCSFRIMLVLAFIYGY